MDPNTGGFSGALKSKQNIKEARQKLLSVPLYGFAIPNRETVKAVNEMHILVGCVFLFLSCITEVVKWLLLFLLFIFCYYNQ